MCTWLGSCVEVLLQERHRVDLCGVSGRVEKLHGCKLPWAAAQLVQTWCEVKPPWVWGSKVNHTPRTLVNDTIHSSDYCNHKLGFLLFGSPTLQHAVVCFPVPPPKGLPESCGLCPLITFPDGDFAAAVEACFQRTTAQRQRWLMMTAQHSHQFEFHLLSHFNF